MELPFLFSPSLFSLSPEYDTHVWELSWLGLILGLSEALVCPSEGENSWGIPPALAVVLTVKWVSIDWLKKRYIFYILSKTRLILTSHFLILKSGFLQQTWSLPASEHFLSERSRVPDTTPHCGWFWLPGVLREVLTSIRPWQGTKSMIILKEKGERC